MIYRYRHVEPGSCHQVLSSFPSSRTKSARWPPRDEEWTSKTSFLFSFWSRTARIDWMCALRSGKGNSSPIELVCLVASPGTRWTFGCSLRILPLTVGTSITRGSGIWSTWLRKSRRLSRSLILKMYRFSLHVIRLRILTSQTGPWIVLLLCSTLLGSRLGLNYENWNESKHDDVGLTCGEYVEPLGLNMMPELYEPWCEKNQTKNQKAWTIFEHFFSSLIDSFPLFLDLFWYYFCLNGAYVDTWIFLNH